MHKATPIILIAIFVLLSGCGGGSTSTSSSVVAIQSTRFSPRQVTIPPGGKVMFVNQDTAIHQVVSGTLVATSNPVVAPLIPITLNGFQPSTTQINLGDTLQFRNDTGVTVNMNLLDDANTVISSFSLLPGQILTFSQFPHAGAFTFKATSGVIATENVVVFGIPNPDNRFATPTLQPGQSVTLTFPNSGTFDFFDLNMEQMNRSFMTGTILVQ